MQARLWSCFPGGPNQLSEELVKSPKAAKAKLVKAIRKAGMQDQRASQICELLSTLRDTAHDDRNVDDALEWLRREDTVTALGHLCGFKGVGPKVASCCLAFTCRHDLLPVDTNVAKMAYRLKWTTNTDMNKVQEDVNGLKGQTPLVVPTSTGKHPKLRLDIHCVLIQMGIDMRSKDSALRQRIEHFIARWALR